jgi:hypothetical protein
MNDVPRAVGGTCYPMGFMLAYNQLNSDPAMRTYNSVGVNGLNGGLGRKGSQRMVIFQTDGAPTSAAYDSFSNMFKNNGAGSSFFKVRIKDPSNMGSSGDAANEYPNRMSGEPDLSKTETLEIVNALCNLETASTPGYSTNRKPVLVHTIAFGSIFNPANTSTAAVTSRNNALTLLQQIQAIGRTQQDYLIYPQDASIPLPSSKIIASGTGIDPIQNLQDCYRNIMQDGRQIVLIE